MHLDGGEGGRLLLLGSNDIGLLFATRITYGTALWTEPTQVRTQAALHRSD